MFRVQITFGLALTQRSSQIITSVSSILNTHTFTDILAVNMDLQRSSMVTESDGGTTVTRINKTYQVYRGTSPTTSNRMEVRLFCFYRMFCSFLLYLLGLLVCLKQYSNLKMKTKFLEIKVDRPADFWSL